MKSTQGRKPASGAKLWFAKGTEAMNHRNWNYALQCMKEAVHLDPGNLSYRRLKHRASRRNCGKDGRISKVDHVKLATVKSRLMTAVIKKDWPNIDKLSEEGNALNPWDAEFYANMAKAASNGGNLKLAKYSWNAAVKIDAKNASYYRELGGVLQQLGEYDQARNCFRRIGDIDPTGRVSEELIAAVDIAALIDLGGYAKATSTQEVRVISDQDAINNTNVMDAIRIDDKNTVLEPSPHEQLVASITLGDQHVLAGRLCSAMEAYSAAVKIAPDNVSVRRRREDVELAYLRQEAMAAQENLQANPQPNEVRTTAAKKLAELTDRELQIRHGRNTEEPRHAHYAFQLADLYRRTSQFAQAVSLFEQVMENQELKAESLIGLGECLIHTERASVGHQHLNHALTMISPKQKPNSFKLAHYWLARLYEAQNYEQQARHHYTTIADIDRNFRDVARRLAKFAEAKVS